jgi:hypothetical protein
MVGGDPPDTIQKKKVTSDEMAPLESEMLLAPNSMDSAMEVAPDSMDAAADSAATDFVLPESVMSKKHSVLPDFVPDSMDSAMEVAPEYIAIMLVVENI